MTAKTDRLITRPVLYSLVGAVALGVVLYVLRGVLAPVLLAFLLAYVFNPLVEFLVRHRFPRTLACALCLLILLVITVGLFALIVPTIHQELQGLAQRIPAWLDKIRQSVIPWLENTFGMTIPGTLNEALDKAGDQLSTTAGELAGPLAGLLQNLVSGAVSLILSLVYVIIIPLFTFYFLADYRQITGWFKNLIPVSRREKAMEVIGDIDGVLSGFLRGQGTVCSILAVVYAIALPIAGVPAGVTIGMVAGLFNFVPYLGTATGVLLSCLFLLLEGASGGTYVAVAGIFIGVNVLDGLFLTPRVLGRKLGLAPVAVILAIMAFGEVFGFLGVLMAVPMTAVGKVLGTRALKAYRRSRAYQGKASDQLPDSTENHEEDQARPE
jgi:predicted PurR-regulated permease PerM